jgi:hypothetical protein
MIPQVPGHRYLLENFKNKAESQEIQFYQKLASENSEEEIDGTTNEEVLAMLIDRIGYLNAKFPSPYNESALSSIEDALAALSERTAERQARGVEGTNQL